VEDGRIQHAKILHPAHADNFSVADIFSMETSSFGDRYDYLVVMPGRLTEVDETRRRWFREKALQTGATLFAYAYDEWILKWGNISNLCRDAGMHVVEQWAEDMALVEFGE
jgi:hypothetical protein